MTFILGMLLGSAFTIGISFVIAGDEDDDDYTYSNSGHGGQNLD